jgi:hypothetical protein
MLTDSVNLVSLDFDIVGKGIEFVETFEMARQIIQDRVESYGGTKAVFGDSMLGNRVCGLYRT